MQEGNTVPTLMLHGLLPAHFGIYDCGATLLRVWSAFLNVVTVQDRIRLQKWYNNATQLIPESR